jgi:hypothetical protein
MQTPRDEILGLLARSFEAGMFGLVAADPRRFASHFEEGRIHPIALAEVREDAVLVAVGYLFRARPVEAWQTRFAFERGLDDEVRARTWRSALRRLTELCRDEVSPRSTRGMRAPPQRKTRRSWRVAGIANRPRLRATDDS